MQIRWMSAFNILLGAWVIVSPWILGYTTTASKVNSVIFGTAVLIFAAVREFAPQMNWSSWINFIAALWLIVSPFILQVNTTAAYWNLVITGIVIAVLSYVNAYTHVSTTHRAM